MGNMPQLRMETTGGYRGIGASRTGGVLLHNREDTARACMQDLASASRPFESNR
jgi:hypothetical protein